MNWTASIDKIEKYIEKLGIPEPMLGKLESVEDILPSDPSNVSPKEISDKLFEYSAYVSYLDVELGRIDSQRSIIDSELTSTIETSALSSRTSKPKTRAMLMSEPQFAKAFQKYIELDALYRRIAGLREGYAVRMNAISREITRRREAP